MKVSELINILSKHDPDKKVMLLSGVGEIGEIEGVEEESNIKSGYGLDMPYFNYSIYKIDCKDTIIIWTNSCINE